jgi:hypothetical protein
MGLKFNPFTGKLDFTGSAGGGGSPTGAAGGDLAGTYPNPTVDGLQGRPVSNATPVNGQVLQYDGANWVPGSIPSGGSGGGGVVYYLNFNTTADSPVTNIPQTPNTSKELGLVGDTTATSYLSPILSTASYDFLASFVTDVSTPSATAIPAGIWDFNLFIESTTTNSANQIYFKVEILKYDGTNAPTLLATSNDTYIYDPAEINQYIASVVMPQTTILATDRIVVYLYGRAHQNNNRLTFHFGGSYPSHTHSTIPSVTGTGVVKVVNGVFQSPATTIVNADVSASAAIEQSKIQNLTTDLSGKVNKSGDTMTGKLVAAADDTSSKLNIGVIAGTSPTSTVNGDLWITGGNRVAWRSGNVSYNSAATNLANSFNQAQTISISSGTATALKITQLGTGESLRIEDESPESTPFVVSASGRVGVGVTPDTTVALSVDSTGIKFGDGTIQTTAPVNADWNASSGLSQILNKPPIPDFQSYTLYEHFLQGNLAINNLRNLTGGGGSSSSAVTARQYNSTGVVSLATGITAAVAHSAMGIDQVNENAVDLSQASKNIFTSRCAFFTMPNASATGIWYSGFVDNYNAFSTNGAYFRIVNNGNLEAVVVIGGVETANDLGFRPATGQMNLYEVISASTGLDVYFYYNGTLVSAITDIIPIGRVNYATGIARTSTVVTTSLEFDLDLVFVRLYNTGFTLQY